MDSYAPSGSSPLLWGRIRFKEQLKAMARSMSRTEFERLVAKTLEALPKEFREYLENVAVRVEDEPSADMQDTMGLYEGVPLTERSLDDVLVPDCITLYKGPIERSCKSRAEMEAEIAVTVIHEVGHFFGLDDGRLEELEQRLQPRRHP